MFLFALLGMVFITALQWVLVHYCCWGMDNTKSQELKVSDALSSSAAVVAVLATIYSYYQHKQDEKAKMTAEYNERYRKDEGFNEVVESLIELQQKEEQEKRQVKPEIDAKTINKREMFLRFMEEIQYLIEKELIDEDEAYDLFGYYANQAVKSGKKFLDDLKDPDEEDNWKTLYKFVDNYRLYKK